MTSTLDLSAALGLRVANTDILEVRIANTTVWTYVPPFSYTEGFESSTGGWAVIGVGHTLSRVTTPVRTGSGSLFMNTTSTGTRNAGVTITGLTVGKTYDASAWIRSTSSASISNFLLGVTGLSTGSAVNPASNVWAQVTYSFTATATSHQLFVRYTTTSTAQDAYVDDVSVVEH